MLHIYFYVELQIHTTFCFSLVDKLTNCESETKIFLLSNTKVCNRDHLRFFDQVGHQTHTIYTRNNMGQKCEGNCGLWVPNEILEKLYPEKQPIQPNLSGNGLDWLCYLAGNF